MSDIENIKKLRQSTGAGFKDCNAALKESSGDIEKAAEILRVKGIAKASKKMSRDAKEGVVVVSGDSKKTSLIEVNCETDFVARNEDFYSQANAFLNAAYDNNTASVETLLAIEIDGRNIADHLQDMTGKIGEKIQISTIILVTTKGTLVSYVHPGNQLGVLVEFDGSSVDSEIGKDVAMQVAAMKPIAVTEAEVDSYVVEKELEIAKVQLINEGKPEEIAEKAAKGKLRRFYEERVLLNQKFVKDNGLTVKKYLEENNAPLVASFHRIQLGGDA